MSELSVSLLSTIPQVGYRGYREFNCVQSCGCLPNSLLKQTPVRTGISNANN